MFTEAGTIQILNMWKRLFSKKRSTADVTVFALRLQSAYEKKIDLGRAKREGRVREFLSSTSAEGRAEFLKFFSTLTHSLLDYATVTERLLFFFDNNAIQDVLKKDDPNEPTRNCRFHALLAFLALAQDHCCLDIFACVSPAVLYEAAGRGTRPIEAVEAEVWELLAEVGLRTHRAKYSRPSDLKKIFKKIRQDEREIHLALQQIKGTSWRRDFSKGQATTFPRSVAEDECPHVSLGYFDPWYVKHLLMDAIGSRMYQENKEARVRRLMGSPNKKDRSVLKQTRHGVEGLGDIELLSCCDLNSQTNQNAPDITMAITFDGALQSALRIRAIESHHMTMEGGADDASDSALRWTHFLCTTERRTQKANKRANEYLEIIANFTDAHFGLGTIS